MSNFKENVLFELEKEKPLKNINEFKYKIYKKYHMNLYNNDLYKKITNYQIDKYGSPIIKDIPIPSIKERKNNNHAANARKYRARNGRVK